MKRKNLYLALATLIVAAGFISLGHVDTVEAFTGKLAHFLEIRNEDGDKRNVGYTSAGLHNASLPVAQFIEPSTAVALVANCTEAPGGTSKGGQISTLTAGKTYYATMVTGAYVRWGAVAAARVSANVHTGTWYGASSQFAFASPATMVSCITIDSAVGQLTLVPMEAR